MLPKIASFWPSQQPATVNKAKATLLDESVAGSKPSRSKKSSTLQRFQSDSWSWEILAIVFSLACSIALIILLNEYDSAPVPQFQYGITLNAMISILATAAKGSFLLPVAEALSQHKWLWFRNSEQKLVDFNTFDEASRGPWGSLKMLVRINFRDIGSFGALITVLSLAFDPFMQQVVAYELRSVHSDNTSITRTQSYVEDHTQMDSQHVTFKLRAALYNGVLNGDAVPDFTPFCHTGNCTWAPVSTLALCSACENVEPESAVSCIATNVTSEINVPQTNKTAWMNCSYSSKQWYLPGFNASYWPAASGVISSVSSMDRLLSSPQNFAVAGMLDPWAVFSRAMFSEPIFSALTITNITFCAFAPCIKTHNVSVREGNLTSEVLNTWLFESFKPPDAETEDLFVTFPEPPADLIKGTRNLTFSIDPMTANGIFSLLRFAFRGTANATYLGVGTGNKTYLGISYPAYTSDIIQALYLTDDLGGMMENVARSISSHMCAVSGEAVQGKLWAMETYVHVRWVWVTFPMALIPASLLFLYTAIWTSRKPEVGIWKSSSLAVLFHGLENTSTLLADDLHRQSNMEKISDEINVRLQRTDDDVQKLVDMPKKVRIARVDQMVSSTAQADNTVATPSGDSFQIPTGTPEPFRIPRRFVGSA